MLCRRLSGEPCLYFWRFLCVGYIGRRNPATPSLGDLWAPRGHRGSRRVCRSVGSVQLSAERGVWVYTRHTNIEILQCAYMLWCRVLNAARGSAGRYGSRGRSAKGAANGAGAGGFVRAGRLRHGGREDTIGPQEKCMRGGRSVCPQLVIEALGACEKGSWVTISTPC